MSWARNEAVTPIAAASGLPQMIRAAAEPLPAPEGAAFGRLFRRFGAARVVLLGQSSPDDAEVRRARTSITRWLIEHHGFTVVAAAADTPPHPDATAFLSWLESRNAARGLAPKADVHDLARAGGTCDRLRGRRLFETLDALLAAQGADARAVVWATNADVGDAQEDEARTLPPSLGQLCREAWGDEAALIGFGAGGWESLSDRAGMPRFLLDLRPGRHEALRQQLAEAPGLEPPFDAWVWLDAARAAAIPAASHDAEPPAFRPAGPFAGLAPGA